MLSLRYLRKNKKQTLTVIIGTILASILLFSVGLLFSSFRNYLIKKALTQNDYHVKITGTLNEVNYDNISSFKEDENVYLIYFKNIKKVKEYTKNLCSNNACENITYNEALLSLYGIGQGNYLDLFKELIFIIVFILGISVFFIIYNSFQISVLKKREDIALLKAVGLSNWHIFKIFFLEGLIAGIIGIVLGFLLSLLSNLLIIKIINTLLTEVLNLKLTLEIYPSFILVPLLFMILIVFLGAFLPLFKIKKYKAMELFRENKSVYHTKTHIKNFLLNYAYTNYKRNAKKYRSLILCVFILLILYNSLNTLSNYITQIISDYVTLPSYDVSLKVASDDYDKLSDLTNYLEAEEKIIFKTCYQNGLVNGEDKEILITNLGKEEVINLVNEVKVENEKMKIYKYTPFESNLNISVNDFKSENVSLTEEVPFGFDNLLKEDYIILNLDEENFNMACPTFEGEAFVKTDKQKLDEMITSYASENKIDLSYVNVKKGYELLNNFILLIKLFALLCTGIISTISIFMIFNITSANIKYRQREFASLKSLGLENKKISLCLLAESFIISGKGTLYAFPFALIISNTLYKNIGLYFETNLPIFNYQTFAFSFAFIFSLIFGCMLISHKHLYRQSLIRNIKSDNL